MKTPEQPPPLRNHRNSRGDNFIGRKQADLAVLKANFALLVGHLAGNRLEERRLAGAVRAYQRNDAALRHCEVDAEQGLKVAVFCDEVADFEHLRHDQTSIPM